MSGIIKLTLFIYNLVILALGCAFTAAAIGRPEPMQFIKLATTAGQNRMILGIVGIIMVILAAAAFIPIFRRTPKEESIVVENAVTGQISMTVPAAKVIINKAVQKVNGVKETRVRVIHDTQGLTVYLHMMINADLNIPDLSKQVQDVIKEDMLRIGGLQVNEIRVLVDDLGTAAKSAVK